jgi:hypothetical protein
MKRLICAVLALTTLAACDQQSQQGLGGVLFGTAATLIIQEALE